MPWPKVHGPKSAMSVVEYACTVLLVEEGGTKCKPVDATTTYCSTEKAKKKAVLACIALAATMDGKHITTVAGLSQDGELHPVQKAFVDESAIQCGFCSPGMVLKAVSILEKNPKPTEDEIRRGLEGNICRCTGYVKIIKAVQVASKITAAGKQ